MGRVWPLRWSPQQPYLQGLLLFVLLAFMSGERVHSEAVGTTERGLCICCQYGIEAREPAAASRPRTRRRRSLRITAASVRASAGLRGRYVGLRQQYHLAATAEKLVHEADGDSTVPDRGRDALDRAAAYVAGGEHTGKARLQQHG